MSGGKNTIMEKFTTENAYVEDRVLVEALCLIDTSVWIPRLECPGHFPQEV